MFRDNPFFTSEVKRKLYGDDFFEASKQQLIEEVETWKR
ncbi:MAG: Unknown protein [uncultured Sulfurovum sp.]|uniref:Uncharacterized protein n=1 Tax=uncultured Sulfurovum sp. TaxID=269237 RepID=A0A6S6T210_9BACT|nr:MAG: Unknown protein [uncultured Sulfurovum sp.]